jgi:hypothetical protein
MNDDLVIAINEKRLIRFVYRVGTHRIVEPHDYGIMKGVETLLGYQLSGESQSGAARGWKLFEVDNIRHLTVMERGFAGSRADKRQQHHTWEALFARVSSSA